MSDYFDSLNVMTVLEVEGVRDEDELHEIYTVKHDDLTLKVTLVWFEPRVEISVRRQCDTRPMFHLSFRYDHIERVWDQQGERLEFRDCTREDTRSVDCDVLRRWQVLFSVQLWIKPHICVQLA